MIGDGRQMLVVTMTASSLYVVSNVGLEGQLAEAVAGEAAVFRLLLHQRGVSRQPRRFIRRRGSGVSRQMQFDHCATKDTIANFYATTVRFDDFSYHRQADAVTGH